MKNIVLSQTCQGEVLRYLLLFSPEFRERYTCSFVPNYEVVDGVSRVASPEVLTPHLKTCDLFIYHAITDYDFGAILKTLPEGCPSLAVPYVTSTIYWPSYDFRHPVWLLPYAATALIPWPCRLLDAMIVAFKDKDRARREYLDLDIPSVMDVAENHDSQLRYIRQAEQGTIFSMSAYIQEHFRDQRLFHLINHPSIPLFRHMANCLLLHLGLSPLTLSPTDPFDNHQMPVHPSIRRYYGLTWCDDATRYKLFEKEVAYDEYVSIYIDSYIERFQFQPPPQAKKTHKTKQPGKRLAKFLKMLLGRRN